MLEWIIEQRPDVSDNNSKIRVWLFCWISVRLQSPTKKKKRLQWSWSVFSYLLFCRRRSGWLWRIRSTSRTKTVFSWYAWQVPRSRVWLHILEGVEVFFEISSIISPQVSMISSVWLQLYFVPLFCDWWMITGGKEDYSYIIHTLQLTCWHSFGSNSTELKLKLKVLLQSIKRRYSLKCAI